MQQSQQLGIPGEEMVVVKVIIGNQFVCDGWPSPVSPLYCTAHVACTRVFLSGSFGSPCQLKRLMQHTQPATAATARGLQHGCARPTGRRHFYKDAVCAKTPNPCLSSGA